MGLLSSSQVGSGISTWWANVYNLTCLLAEAWVLRSLGWGAIEASFRKCCAKSPSDRLWANEWMSGPESTFILSVWWRGCGTRDNVDLSLFKTRKVFNDRHYARTGLFMNYSEEESSIWPTLRVKLRKVHFIFVIYNFVCISSRGQVGQRERLFS